MLLYMNNLVNRRASNNYIKDYSDDYVEGGRLGVPLKDRFRAVKRGIRQDYSHSVYEYILRHYSDEIFRIEVCRRPISSAINTALNLMSLGKWNKMKHKYGYDTFYHLFIVAHMKSGNRIIIEKNAVINVGDFKKFHSNERCVPVPMNNFIKLGEFMKRGEAHMKDRNYFTYDPFKNNCQVFVFNMLRGNGLLNEKLKDFILQDIDGIVSAQKPFLPKVAKAITDVGGLADKFLEGETSRDEIKENLKPEISGEAYEGGGFNPASLLPLLAFL